jgi:hypothetical protein
MWTGFLSKTTANALMTTSAQPTATVMTGSMRRAVAGLRVGSSRTEALADVGDNR